MNRIVILNSYTLTDKEAAGMVRIKYFFKALEQEGYREGENIGVEFIDSNDLGEIQTKLGRIKQSDIRLIHAVGSPNAAIAAQYTEEIPVVYYGAHPDDVGREACQKKNCCGMELTLPFSAHYKNFRFIKRLIPGVKNIYVPFFEKTLFCPGPMKEKYETFRETVAQPAWQPHDSPFIGYRSLAGLCYIIGVNYFEFLYRGIDELAGALASIEPECSLIMPYNDSVYCKDAPAMLLETSLKKKIPLVWNNNPEAAQLGAVAAIAGCFKESGSVNGAMAGKILNGALPTDLGFQVSSRSYSSVNIATAAHFGIQLSQDVVDYFDEVLH
jgi:ABC-type uncharacterized transport system substrate-binding protein